MTNHELNAWLAEHIMGWKRVDLGKETQTRTFAEVTSYDLLIYRPSKMSGQVVWDPASNMNQAIEVAEKITRGDPIGYLTLCNLNDNWTWRASFQDWYGDIGVHQHAPAPALAVCRAAKAWKEAPE